MKRWTRFGHDRLYVSHSDGTEVGWSDLRTGEAHPASRDDLPLLTHALAAWQADVNEDTSAATPVDAARSAPISLGEHGPPIAVDRDAEPDARSSLPPTTPVMPTSYGSTAQSPPWTDLAANAPGAAARACATSLRDAAPVRTFFARLVDLKTPERAWRLGADGEQLVAARLARLGQREARWRVLHAISVGTADSDIDHLVVGPGGVFSLNAKHHPGASMWVAGDTFMVNGQRHPYVRNSRHEAARSARLLGAAAGVPIHVRGVIVPVRGRSLTVKSAPADVDVVPRNRIATWLLARPPVLDDRAVTLIFEAARRSTTWHPTVA